MRSTSQMPTTITIDNTERHDQRLDSPQSSSRSASRSDSITDGSDSYDSLLDESWDQVYSDEIEPSESASRPRTSTYRNRERPPPARRPARRHTTTERSRSAPRIHRHPGSGRPPSTVDSDHFPGYGRGYPEPPPGYGGGGRMPGYAPSAYSAVGAPGPYAPPFGAPGALTHYGPGGGYPPYPSQQNPFSPQSAAGPPGAGYFNGAHHPISTHGTPGPYGGHEVMPYPMPGYGYPGYHQPPPPAMSPQMQYFQGWGGHGSDHGSGDPEMEKQMLALQEQMKKAAIDAEKTQKELLASSEKAKKEYEAFVAKEEGKKAAAEAKAEADKKAAEEKAAWEKKLEEGRKEAQKAGAENAKKQIEADKRKAEELAAEEKSKADLKAAVEKAEKEKKEAIDKAEKEAKEAVAKAEKEAKESVEKAEKEAKESVEKAEKEAKESVDKALAPKDDKKKPIRFKDAVGRKFSFPFHLCSTWVGMEELIRQAFVHVDLLGQHVAEGHYDLVGPNGEIILPQVWETMIEPDWSVTMHMWPIPEKPPGVPGMPPHLERPRSRHGNHGHRQAPPVSPPAPGHRGVPPAPPATWRPPGAGVRPGPGPGPGPNGQPAVVVMPPGTQAPRAGGSSSRRKQETKGGVLSWMAGSSKPKSSGKGPKKAEPAGCLVM